MQLHFLLWTIFCSQTSHLSEVDLSPPGDAFLLQIEQEHHGMDHSSSGERKKCVSKTNTTRGWQAAMSLKHPNTAAGLLTHSLQGIHSTSISATFRRLSQGPREPGRGAAAAKLGATPGRPLGVGGGRNKSRLSTALGSPKGERIVPLSTYRVPLLQSFHCYWLFGFSFFKKND